MELDSKKKIAVYARVSTDHEDQKDSIQNQQIYFQNSINLHPNWELYKIYADEGISGTSLKHRNQFNKMMEEAMSGKFDIILTKEVCRFARNTVDTLEKTRQLKNMGIEVRFLIDNISTFDTDGELRLTIMAGLAQDESRRISERVRFGINQEMKRGVAFGSNMYGYDFKKGKITINQEQAEVVKEIFRLFLEEDLGTYKIAKILKERGIPILRPRKNRSSTNWCASTIQGILSNEKYIGTLVSKKYYSVDYLTHERKKNKGELQFYRFENHHEPIIDKETFQKAQIKLDKLKEKYTTNKDGVKKENALKGKIICARCGRNYLICTSSKRKDGTRRKTWKCGNSMHYGTKRTAESGEIIGCDNETAPDNAVKEAVKIAVARANIDTKDIESNLMSTLSSSIISNKKQSENTIKMLVRQKENLEDEKNRLLDLYLNGTITTSVFKAKNVEIETKIKSVLKDIKENSAKQKKEESAEEVMRKIAKKIKLIIDNRSNDGDDIICKQLVEKISIYDRKNCDIYLKNIEKPIHIDNLNKLEY